MRHLPLILLCLWTASTSALAEGLGVSAERVREVLRTLPQFAEATIQEQIEGKTRRLLLAAEPKDDPDAVIEMYGARADLDAVFVRVKGAPRDPSVDAAIGLLIPVLVPEFGSPPAATARSFSGEEMPLAFRWPLQFQGELMRLDSQRMPFAAWHAGGRTILVARQEAPSRERLVYFYRGPPLRPTWGSAPQPRNGAVAAVLAAFAAGRYDAALAQLRPLAAAGDPEAQAWLADALLLQRGVAMTASSQEGEARRKEIAALLEAATAKNEPHAQFLRAIEGARSDALAWHLKAALQGHAGAQFEVAMARIGADEAEATAWLEVSARLGHLPSMIGIAGQYENGDGVSMDKILAYYWYRVFELHFPQPVGADPEEVRQMSRKVAGGLGDADRARLDAEAAAWKPVGFSDIKRGCSTRRCPKELQP